MKWPVDESNAPTEEVDVRVRSIPWPRVFLEAAVIVGSILLAFALDAWWDDRNRRDELRNQLGVVAGEIQSAYQALEVGLEVHEWNAHLADRLAAALDRVDEGSVVVVSDSLIGPLLPQATTDVTTGSLEAFIAAGGLELIENPEVRGHLLAWPTRVLDLQDDEIYLRNFAAADLSAYLRANAAIANAERQAAPLLLSRFGVGPEVDPDLLGTVVLRREQHLMNLLAAREAGERGMRRGLVEMLEQATSIVSALETSLGNPTTELR